MPTETVIIYVDELIIINICFDMICLYITSLICNARSSPLKMLCGAAVGGVYSLFSPFIGQVWLSALSAVLCETAICLIAFGMTNAKDFLTRCLFFAVSCAVVGGIISAVYSLLGIPLSAINTPTVLISALIISPIVAVYLLAARRRSKRDIARVVITKNGISVDVQMLVDSGNTASEPISGLPLVFLARPFLPRFLKDGNTNTDIALRAAVITTATSIETVYCFIPDAIIIYRGKKAHKVNAAIVCGKRDEYCGTGGLLPASLI